MAGLREGAFVGALNSIVRVGLAGVCVLSLVACDWSTGDNNRGVVKRVDAEFDPASASNATAGINEATPGAAQTFTVQNDGKFEEFWIVLLMGNSADDGIVEVTVRPLTATGEPDADPMSSIITPIGVDTSTLPANEVFTEFFVGNDPGRQVLAGEEYAIVVEFVSRATNTDTAPIAVLVGQINDPYPDGTGSRDSGAGFVNNTDDYFFRTFLLR